MQVPDEAVQAALAKRSDLLSDLPDPIVLSEETLTRRMPEAAAPAMEKTRDEALRAALNSLTSCATTSAGDFGAYGPDAWLYGIIAGWDCEEDHEHDSICGGTAAMEELAARHRWDDAAVGRLRRHRRAFAAASSPGDDAAPGNPLGEEAATRKEET